MQDVRSELKGDYRDLCAALLQDQATQDAELLNYSIGGLGTNEAALIHILVSRTPQVGRLVSRQANSHSHERMSVRTLRDGRGAGSACTCMYVTDGSPPANMF